MKKIFYIELGTYPFQLIVDVGHTDEEFKKWLEKNTNGLDITDEEVELFSIRGEARTGLINNEAPVLRIKDFKRTPFFYGILVHEIFHVVEFLFEKIGIEHDVDKSSEAYAYQIQFIVENVLKGLEAVKKKK